MEEVNIMKNKKVILLISIFAVFSLMITSAVVGINIYKKSILKNVDIYISAVTLVENPDDPNNEEVYGLLNQFFNQTVGDICVYYDTYSSEAETEKEFTEAEKAMKFDLDKYNVYKFDVVCENTNSAEDKFIFVKARDFCSESKYMKAPCNVSSCILLEPQYYFISKEYSEEDVKEYLKNTGSSVNVYIGKDELRPIANYDKAIFYEPEKATTVQ